MFSTFCKKWNQKLLKFMQTSYFLKNENCIIGMVHFYINCKDKGYVPTLEITSKFYPEKECETCFYGGELDNSQIHKKFMIVPNFGNFSYNMGDPKSVKDYIYFTDNPEQFFQNIMKKTVDRDILVGDLEEDEGVEKFEYGKRLHMDTSLLNYSPLGDFDGIFVFKQDEIYFTSYYDPDQDGYGEGFEIFVVDNKKLPVCVESSE